MPVFFRVTVCEEVLEYLATLPKFTLSRSKEKLSALGVSVPDGEEVSPLCFCSEDPQADNNSSPINIKAVVLCLLFLLIKPSLSRFHIVIVPNERDI